MTKGQSLVEYYNGIAAFYNYLGFHLGAENFNPKLIEDKRVIRNAKVAFLALFFSTEKEEMVEKKETETGAKDQFSSKIIDKALVDSIEMVAENKGAYYQIGDYTEENPANIIALIRNKFAHGKYEIDTINNLVIIKNKTNTLRIPINIDKLFFLVCKSVQNLVAFPKANSVTRIHAQNKHLDTLGFDVITTREQARILLKSSRFKEYKFFSLDKRDIEFDALEAFSKLVNGIKICYDDSGKTTPILQIFKNFANKQKLELMISNRRAKDDEIEEILDLLDKTDGFYELGNLRAQVEFVLTRAVEKLSPEYQKGHLLSGIIYDMILLCDMETKNEFDFKKLCQGQSSNIFNITDECVISAIIAEFESLYVYPLEDMYLDGSKYSLDRESQLDFGALDLDFLVPKKITIYDSPLTQERINYDARIKELSDKKEEIKKLELNLEKAKLKGNTKAITFLEENIKTKKEELINICINTKNAVDSYDVIRDDYRKNHKYFRNRAIIEGIRNAISHGHVILKKFESEGDMDNIIINFQDIYEGEITFEADITLRDFEKLFYKENMTVILDFLNKKEGLIFSSKDPKEFKKVMI